MQRKAEALAEWRTGWPLVLAVAVGIIGHSSHNYPLGMFMKPLAEDLGWSRAQISTAMLIFAIGNLVLAPVVGFIADRFGPRRIVLFSAPLVGLGTAALSLTGPSITSWFAVWAAVAVVGPGISAVIWTVALTRHFNASRGLALAVAFCGSGIGAALWPSAAVILIGALGWRGAYAAIGIGVAVIVTTTMFFCFRGPATGPSETSRGGPSPHADRAGMTLGQALSTSIFWRIALVLCVVAATVSSVTVHLPSLLADEGLSRFQAASAVGMIGVAAILGRLLGGVLLDRYEARYVAASFFALPIVSCALLIGYDGSFARAALAAVLIGMVAGIEGELLSVTLSRYFGLRNVGAVYGAAFSIFGLGYGGAPALGGAVFDSLGSYDAGLIVLLVLLVPCVIVALTFGAYPERDEKPVEARLRDGAATPTADPR